MNHRTRTGCQAIPDSLLTLLAEQGMSSFAQTLRQQHEDYFKSIRHGDFSCWQYAIDHLPAITPSEIHLNKSSIQIGTENDCNNADRQNLKQKLQTLMPWRKGPFDRFGINLDAEWQSNIKWDRFANEISALEGRLVLDVGSGNGYYSWRMLGESARAVVGIDPTLRFAMQFHAANTYINNEQIHIFPFRLEQLMFDSLSFDTVFSMGVLYHQRDPLAHLKALYRSLRSGGELVVETLIVNQDDITLLKPEGRYAKMNNVWNIPSCNLLMEWVLKSNFSSAEIVDVSTTTTDEQRGTDWMEYESLADFLDPDDPGQTIEGYPAPKRAIVIARKS